MFKDHEINAWNDAYDITGGENKIYVFENWYPDCYWHFSEYRTWALLAYFGTGGTLHVIAVEITYSRRQFSFFARDCEPIRELWTDSHTRGAYWSVRANMAPRVCEPTRCCENVYRRTDREILAFITKCLNFNAQFSLNAHIIKCPLIIMITLVR